MIPLTVIDKPARAQRSPVMVYGASLGPRGGALVGALHGAGVPTVMMFSRYPANLVTIGQDLQQLPEEAVIFVDAGLHGADLWAFLGRSRPSRHWRLFEVARPELRRAEIAGRLRAAFELKAFAIQRGLPDEAALRKAVAESTRDDAGDRPEVCALSLAVVDRRPPPPRIF